MFVGIFLRVSVGVQVPGLGAAGTPVDRGSPGAAIHGESVWGLTCLWALLCSVVAGPQPADGLGDRLGPLLPCPLPQRPGGQLWCALLITAPCSDSSLPGVLGALTHVQESWGLDLNPEGGLQWVPPRIVCGITPILQKGTLRYREVWRVPGVS